MPLTSIVPLLSLATALAGGPIVRVEGSARCPAADELAARVTELLPGSVATGDPDVIHLREDAAGLHLSLRRPDGQLVGERLLERNPSCADLTAAAAVVVAIWESDVHPEFTLRIEPTADGAGGTEGAPSPPTTFDVGAGLLGSVAPGGGKTGLAAGLLLAASWTAASGTSWRWGLRTSVAGTTERQLPLPFGAVNWRRVTLAAGPHLRFVGGSRWVLDLHADVLGARLHLSGAGFRTNVPDSAFEPGLGAGARVMLHRGQIAGWVELAVAGWLREQVAFAQPNQGDTTLPRFDGVLALGVSFCGCQ